MVLNGAIGIATIALVSLAIALTAPPTAAQPPDAIAFIDIIGGSQAEVFTIQPDGGGRRQRTSSDGIVEAGPDWAPDGRRLAFAARVGESRWGVNVLDLATGEIAAVTEGPQDLDPAWSPAGDQIAFAAHFGIGGEVNASSLSISPADGIGARPLILLEGGGAVIRHPTWSPDGARIAFAVTSRLREGDLYVIGADGSDPRRLLGHPGWDDVDPAWSPDGRRIAFASGPWSPAGVRHDIWLLDVATGVVGTIATDEARELRRPAWSGDGRSIVFDALTTSGGTTRWDLHIVPATGGPVGAPLTIGREASWAPAGVVPPTRTATPGASPSTPSPTATGPTPTGATATLTPPVVPTFPSFPTLVPFPTEPPPEPTLPGPAPTFPPPTSTSIPTLPATATSTMTITPTRTPGAPASPTPTAGPTSTSNGRVAYLPLVYNEVEPTPTPTSDAPTADVPTAETPGSGTPTSESPTAVATPGRVGRWPWSFDRARTLTGQQLRAR